MTSTFERLVDDLARDVSRAQPKDVLQFCANWFNTRLEEQRARLRDSLSNPSSSQIPSDLYEDIPVNSGIGPGPLNTSPRPSLEQPPVLKNPFGPQSQLSAFSPGNPRAAPSRAAPAAAGTPFLTINEDEPFSPTAFANVNPFATGYTPADHPDSLLPPPALLGRRTSVSAESIIPNSNSSTPLPFHPKTPDQLERIKTSIKENFIFRDVEDKQLESVLGAMEEVNVGTDEIVIRQGDQGDYFYVVESGRLLVYITSEQLPSSITQKQADHTLGIAGYHPIFGKQVAENGPGSSFGELALMYGHPRAATVLAVEPCTLWRLDRITFRTIILKAAHLRRTMYEEFLITVPLLSSLSPEERSKIADALVSWTVEDGEIVIEEGQMGDAFFFIEEGEAIVTKKMKEDNGELEEKPLNMLKKGDYFGGE